ncbi:DoxX family protein [Nonomuraea phyllanthi]|uniref:DoxX family protein n=1 Tax=Nonomuraea phyllanthi TaxID=2219224 RepID=UPI001884E5AF|nr:DoxX family protein [Nonomuraea phyllanthi]
MKSAVFDVAALITRVVAGVIFLAHGLQKWSSGFGPTGQMFREMGVPMPDVTAMGATILETVGGIFLIVGLLVRLVGLALLLDMLAAIAFVHAGRGVLSSGGGWELPGALGALALLFLALGGGRLGLDGLFRALFHRRGERRVAEEELSAYAQRPQPSNVITRPGGGPTTPAQSGEPAEQPQVPRQPGEHQPSRHRPGGMDDEDMRDIDALVSDEPPQHHKPPNRS